MIAMLGISLIVEGLLLVMIPASERSAASRFESAHAPALSPPAPSPPPSASAQLPAQTPSTSPAPAVQPEAATEHLALWPLATTAIAAMLVGGVILVFGRSTWTRIAGTATLLSGLTANGYQIKEVKIGEIFKLAATIDRSTNPLWRAS